jgi:casein kinase II subunit alpha
MRNKKNKNFVSEDSIDLLSKILVFDHKERLSAKEAMDHPFFIDSKEKYEKLFGK